MKRKILKQEKNDWEYICNLCYKKQGECKCAGSVLGLDPNIIEHIQLLQARNYQTVGCCEGHVITYETEGGNVITSLSPLYISLDNHSYEDFTNEMKVNPKWQECGFELIEVKKLNRYQLVYKKMIKKNNDVYEDMKVKKNLILLNLKECILSMKKRKRTEPVIITSY